MSDNYFHCYVCGYHRDFTDEELKNNDFCLGIRSRHQATHYEESDYR